MSDEAYQFFNSGGKVVPSSSTSTVKEDSSQSASYNFFASGGKIPDDMKSLDKPTPSPSNKPEADQEWYEPLTSDNSLANTVLGRTAAGVVGLAKGVDKSLSGVFQLAAHGVDAIYPESMPGSGLASAWKEGEDRNIHESDNNETYNTLTKNTQPSAKIGEFTGNVEGALAIPAKKLGEGVNLFSRMIAAAKTGAKVGAITPNDPSENKQVLGTPLTEDQNYWVQKAIDTGTGALAGFFGQPIAEGAAGAITYPIKKITNVGKRVIDWARGKTPVNDEVANLVQNASPEIQQAINDVAKIGKDIDPTALGRKLQGDSLPFKVQYTEGMAKQDPIKISEEMNTRSKNPAMIQLMDDNNKALINNLNHVRDTGAPDVAVTDHITAGENLIKAGESLIEKKSAETSALYKKLADANGGQLPMDGKTFVDHAEKAISEDWKEEYIPKAIKERLDWLKRTDLGDKNQMTFKNFETLRTLLASESRKAESAGDGNTKHAIGLIRDSLENMPMKTEVGAAKELADAARKSAKQGFDMVRNNPALQAIESGKAADNNFIQKYIIGASKKDLTNLAGTLKDDPVALQTIKAGTVNYLKKSASILEDSGNFGQSGYNKALQALGPKLDVIFSPDEAAVLRTVGNVSRDINLAPKGSYVNTSNTDVANLARSGAAHALDQVTGTPIGSIIKKVGGTVMNNQSEKSRIAEMIGPKAGIGKTNAANEFLNALPRRVGGAAAIPLSTLITRSDKRPAQERP